MNYLLSNRDFKVKALPFEVVPVRSLHLQKVTLVTSGPHSSQKNGSFLLLSLGTTKFSSVEHHSPLSETQQFTADPKLQDGPLNVSWGRRAS